MGVRFRFMPLCWRQVALVVLVLVAVALIALPALAQGAPSKLVIRHLDVSTFPNVTLYVQGLGIDLGQAELNVLEDGQEVDVQAEQAEVGVQVALLLDASRSILSEGNTGQPRYKEAGQAARRFVELKLLDPKIDRLATYVARPEDGQLAILQTWTFDHQAAVDRLFIYDPKEPPEETPLHDLLFSIFDHFDQAKDVSPYIARAVVVFSDGLSGSSSLEISDAIARAQQERVPIFTVLLGKNETGERNMRRLATLTGGQFVRLDKVEDVDAIWRAVAALRVQQRLSYQARSAQPRQVAVVAKFQDGTEARAQVAFPTVRVSPPEVVIVQPQAGLVITKEAPAYDTPLEELEPRQLPIQIQVKWPDGQARAIRRVEYTVGAETRVVEEAPFEQIAFPIDKLDTGRYTVRVVVEDELGVRAEAPPVTFEVDVVRPPAPGAGPAVIEITLGNRVITIPRDRLMMAVNVLVLLVSITALVFALRKPTVRERVVSTVMAVGKTVTEPFRGSQESEEVPAVLKVVKRGRATDLNDEIPLREVTRIGRDPDQAHVVISDTRVSRLHCTITETSRGFEIGDEGSTAGTYVNGRRVEYEKVLLRNGDVIDLGPVRFQFVERRPGRHPDKDRTEVSPGKGSTLGRLFGREKEQTQIVDRSRPRRR